MNQIQGMQSHHSPGGFPVEWAVSENKLSEVNEILSQYDPDTLTEEDGEAIRQAFREAGIRPSAKLRIAMEEAGFDAEALHGPPQPETDGHAPPPPPPGEASVESLEELKEILGNYDLNEMSAEGHRALIKDLEDAGLLQFGQYINISI